MDTQNAIKMLTEISGVSGYEFQVQGQLTELFKEYTDDITTDTFGSVIAKIKGSGAEPRPSVMVTAHADEIGFMVTKIEEGGFLRVQPIGGVDPRTTLAQEVIVHAKDKDLLGIFGAKPPHLLRGDEAKQAIPLTELFIDLGMEEQEVRQYIQIGDVATIRRRALSLLGQQMAAKAMDDRAGIVLMLEMLKEMQQLKIQADVYVVATVQEEIGVRGAMTSSYKIMPDVGIAVDVTHGSFPGIASDLAFELGKGPVVCYGPNMHKNVYKLLIDTAKEQYIPHQIELSQGPTGTDARAIQVTQAGIATGLVSIPLRYMHTSVETLNTKDIVNGGKLLARAIQKIDSTFTEELTCY